MAQKSNFKENTVLKLKNKDTNCVQPSSQGFISPSAAICSLPHQTGGIMASPEKPSKDVTKMAVLVRLNTTPEEKIALFDEWKDYDQVGVLCNLMCQ